jgi:hypothetical protein
MTSAAPSWVSCSDAFGRALRLDDVPLRRDLVDEVMNAGAGVADLLCRSVDTLLGQAQTVTAGLSAADVARQHLGAALSDTLGDTNGGVRPLHPGKVALRVAALSLKCPKPRRGLRLGLRGLRVAERPVVRSLGSLIGLTGGGDALDGRCALTLRQFALRSSRGQTDVRTELADELRVGLVVRAATGALDLLLDHDTLDGLAEALRSRRFACLVADATTRCVWCCAMSWNSSTRVCTSFTVATGAGPCGPRDWNARTTASREPVRATFNAVPGSAAGGRSSVCFPATRSDLPEGTAGHPDGGGDHQRGLQRCSLRVLMGCLASWTYGFASSPGTLSGWWTASEASFATELGVVTAISSASFTPRPATLAMPENTGMDPPASTFAMAWTSAPGWMEASRCPGPWPVLTFTTG